MVVLAGLLAVSACGESHSAIVFDEITTTTSETLGSTTSSAPPSGPKVGPWVDVTGNLAGMPSECGNLSYLVGQPVTGRVIAGVAQRGLWSLGDGDQWSPLGAGSPTPVTNRTNAIVFDPEVPERFWETGSYNWPGAFRTTDAGATFEGMGGGLSHLEGLSVDFTDPERRTMLAGSHEKQELFKSWDGGSTWVDVAPRPLPGGVFASQPLVLGPNTYLLGTSNGPETDAASIFRTLDGGATWEPVFAGGVAGPPLVASNGTIYWALQDGGMVRSDDGGVTWPRTTAPGTLKSYTVVELADGRLASLSRSYAVVSSNGGRSWQGIGPRLPTTNAFGLAYSDARNALYIYSWDCTDRVPAGAVQRLDLVAP